VTLANRITIGRLLLIPVFIVLVMMYEHNKPYLRYAALFVFALASISDALDGFIARMFDQKTRLGAVLDPLADKLLINIAFVFLAVNREFAYRIPAWFPVIVLSRDIIIVLGSYLINEFFGPLRVRPRISGKLTTAFQMATICCVLLETKYSNMMVYITTVLSVISFFDYLRDGLKQVGSEDEHRG